MVGDGDDQGFAPFLKINDAAGKPTHDDAAGAGKVGAAVRREGCDTTRGAVNFREEVGTQAGALGLLVGNLVKKLLFCRWQEGKMLHLSSARAWAKTSADETGCTPPRRYSSTRR